MIKKSTIQGIELTELLDKMEEEMYSKLGYTMKLSHKEFEDIDLTGLEAKKDIDLTDDGLSEIVLDNIDVKFHNIKNKFYIFSNSTLLWVEYNKDAILWEITKSILTPYITTNMIEDSKELTKALEMIKSSSKMASIVKFIMKKIQAHDESNFIDNHFNNVKGLFPTSDGKTIDLRNGISRDRVKEDYFSKTTSVKLLDDNEINKKYHTKIQTDDFLNLRYTKTEIANKLTDTVSVSTFNEAIQQKT